MFTATNETVAKVYIIPRHRHIIIIYVYVNPGPNSPPPLKKTTLLLHPFPHPPDPEFRLHVHIHCVLSQIIYYTQTYTRIVCLLNTAVTAFKSSRTASSLFGRRNLFSPTESRFVLHLTTRCIHRCYCFQVAHCVLCAYQLKYHIFLFIS